MRNNLYKKYPNPHLITDLSEGDLVWAVRYSECPGLAKYRVVRVHNSKNLDFFFYELELEDDFGGWWLDVANFEVEGTRHVSSKKYRRVRFFSDEVVARHSARTWIARRIRNQKGRIKKLHRNLNYLKKIEGRIK